MPDTGWGFRPRATEALRVSREREDDDDSGQEEGAGAGAGVAAASEAGGDGGPGGRAGRGAEACPQSDDRQRRTAVQRGGGYRADEGKRREVGGVFRAREAAGHRRHPHPAGRGLGADTDLSDPRQSLPDAAHGDRRSGAR